jgi:hypothetical protein
VLFLKFVLNNGSVEDAFKAVQKFELAQDGIIIIKTLSDDGGKPSLEFFYFSSENQEVLVEFLLIDVHGIIRQGSEAFDRFSELFRDLFDCLCKSFSLGSTEFDSFEFVELHDGCGEVQDIMASFAVGVQSGEQGIEGQLPFAFRLIFVLEVVLLEF